MSIVWSVIFVLSFEKNVWYCIWSQFKLDLLIICTIILMLYNTIESTFYYVKLKNLQQFDMTYLNIVFINTFWNIKCLGQGLTKRRRKPCLMHFRKFVRAHINAPFAFLLSAIFLKHYLHITFKAEIYVIYIFKQSDF